MKDRKNPKVWFKVPIYTRTTKKYEQIGEIFLVDYLCGKNIPHIEFEIYDKYKEYRNQGIVSKEIIKFLKLCKKWNHHKLIAVVKCDNLASIRILEKNDFIRVSYIRDNYGYMIDLSFNKETVMKMQEFINKKFNHKRYEKRNI